MEMLPEGWFSILIQLPITGFVVWVILQLLKQSRDERKTFLEAMEKADVLFATELRLDRESLEKMSVKTYEALGNLALAIMELRGEVRTSQKAAMHNDRTLQR
jgi:hypothetical protein